MPRNEERCNPSRNGGARRHAEIHDDDEGSAQPLGCELGGERDDIGNDAAQSDAGEEAQHDELAQRCRVRAQQGEDAEADQAPDNRLLAPEAVADIAKERSAEEQPHNAG